MTHTAPHALPLRPAALIVISLHAALLVTLLTNLDHVVGPNVAPVPQVFEVPIPIERQPEPPPLRTHLEYRQISPVDPPKLPADMTPENAISEKPALDDRHDAEPVLARPTVWTRPVVVERTEIAYPTVGMIKPQGVVRLRIHIGVDGRPLDVLVGISSGYPALDHAAQRAVLHWRFRPRLQDGAPIESWAEMPVVFRLQD